ncbi:MAG: sugar ABC transporter permease, partial [Janthinobacterium sp.]
MTTSMPCTEGAPAAAAARPAKKRYNMKQWAPYIFISPFFILFAVFSLFPLLFSIYLSFNQWEAASGVEAMQWVGLDNYKYALSDPWFLRSLGNTVWLALASGVPQHLV